MNGPRFYVITDREAAGERSVPTVLEALLERARAELPAGVLADAVAVQLREKSVPLRALRAQAESVRALTREFGCRLFVNGHSDDAVAVAVAVAADGVHLPESRFNTATVQALRARGLAVGASTHSPEAAASAARAGADLVVLSPVFPTVKNYPQGPPLGPAGLTRAADLMGDRANRLVALGGVLDPERVRVAIAAGARGVAGIRLFMAHGARGSVSFSALWRAVTASGRECF